MERRQILLIEDDAPKATAIVQALSSASATPFDVDWVRCCADAMERLNGVAAILVDLCLPDSQGVETFDRLFKAAPNIPIMVLAGSQDEEAAKLAVLRGAQDYLFKARLDSYMLPKAVTSMIERAVISEALFQQKERAQVTLDSIGDAVISIDLSGAVTFLNAIAEGLTGWAQDQAAGHPIAEVLRVIDGGTRETRQSAMELAIRLNKTVALPTNSVLIRRDGAEAAIEDSAAPIHDRSGQVTGAVMVFRDVSVARAMTLRMSYLAQHDSLTDLPNRVLMNDRLGKAIILSKRHQRQLAVLFVDLDRFKYVNDSMGHVVGDQLLQSVARRLCACVRSSDTVSRQGGDEFVVLLLEERCAQDAAVTAEKILAALREPHEIEQHVLHITASIGVVTYPEDGADAETLLNNADIAMYHAKSNGRDNYQFFEQKMNARAMQRQSLEGDLRRALERQEFSLNYQPKIHLGTSALVGAEALLRWKHPLRGFVPPEEFINLAEECGLIVPIGRWVIGAACLQARAWQVEGLAPVCMAINISPVELRAPGFAAGVRAQLTAAGLEAPYLELELTETFLMQDSRSTVDVLRELKDIGVSLALDDFGTGYSSLTYLKRFPIDALKIDRSFVRDLTSDADDASIVAAVIGMGKSLRMQVVAEGVETREQFKFLQEHECPQGQGYYFAQPLSAEDFRQRLHGSVAYQAAG